MTEDRELMRQIPHEAHRVGDREPARAGQQTNTKLVDVARSLADAGEITTR
jgi:hypothetical protein